MNKVHIEFQRVQTWLFSVPRLRAMVGANTLLGEVLLVKLPELARSGRAWSLSPLAGQFPSADPRDPLGNADDPMADAATGILSRDGGHFEAQFSNGVEAFADAAALLIRRELPGLRFSVAVGDERLPRGSAVLSAELPMLAPCDWTGRGLASVAVQQGTERSQVSLEVSQRHEAARRTEDGSAADLASLFARRTALAERQRPTTFEALAAGDYLAIIHADGNGVGADAPARDGERAAFFHRNRVLLRAALRTATDRCCAESEGPVAPLLVLMLGGDDVLVVCRASVALSFVADLCEDLERLQTDREVAFHLTLGVGVVISRLSMPFHRLHAVAEALTSSAKQKFRGLGPAEKASVVDWAVYTAAWADDPAEVRARDWVRGAGDNARVLSRRPMVAVGTGHDYLQGLLAAASELEAAPRSQLRYLVDQLGRGRTLADLAFTELSAEAKKALEAAGVTGVWSRPEASGPHLTSLLDLVEVFEIQKLGRAGIRGGIDEDVYELDDDEEEVVHG